ncbi:MAG TPA: poly-gamma-glutamate synthase PgsB [Bacteroidales bacterium]|nr:poly-gamma-glutamate synthase PgsB [Bacteroidales bacterium]
MIVSIIVVFIISLLFIEKQMVQRSVRSLRLRIHVNGTRGKSSVTEYVAAGLSDSLQEDVMAKVTGIIPSIIYKGVKERITRYGVARVQEQINIIRLAHRKKVKNLVLECMSIAPDLQKVESSVFQPHIYVITNIRDDHREAMGVSLDSQAEAICSAIPKNCKVITNEKHFLDKIREKAAEHNSTVITAEELDHEITGRLPYGVFPENIALALAVCKEAGVDRNQAEMSIMNWISNCPPPLTTFSDGNKSLHFLNAFAVNDIDSTESFINNWKKVIDHNGKTTIVLNTRADRPLRTEMFSHWIAKDNQSYERIILTGNHKGRARYSLIKSGVERMKIESWKRELLNNFKMNLINILSDRSLVIGVGNIGGDGFHILNTMK